MSKIITLAVFFVISGCAVTPQNSEESRIFENDDVDQARNNIESLEPSEIAAAERPGLEPIVAGPNVRNRCQKRRTTGSNLRKSCDSKDALPTRVGSHVAPPPQGPTAGSVRPNQ